MVRKYSWGMDREVDLGKSEEIDLVFFCFRLLVWVRFKLKEGIFFN